MSYEMFWCLIALLFVGALYFFIPWIEDAMDRRALRHAEERIADLADGLVKHEGQAVVSRIQADLEYWRYMKNQLEIRLRRRNKKEQP